MSGSLTEIVAVELTNPPVTVLIPGGIVPLGAYNPATDYSVGSYVDYGGSSYVMYVDAAAGTLPTDTTKWQVVASKGDTGAKGDTGDTGPAVAGQMFLSASGMYPSATNGCSTNQKREYATNKQNIYELAFDPTTQEFAECTVVMPSDWNAGTITFVPYWTHQATTTNFGVVWQLQARAYANDDALDQAWGTAQTSTDTGGTTGDLYIGPASSAITIGGTPAASQLVQFRVARVPADGDDTLAVDALFLGAMVNFTRA